MAAGVELVASNLRRLRSAAGLSLAVLAERSGVAKGTLSELERGQGNPTIETLFALAYALQVTLADLVDGPAPAAVDVVRALDRPFIPGRPLDARLLHRSLQQHIVFEVYDLVVHPGAVQQAKAHRTGTREQVYLIDGDMSAGPRERLVELGPSDFVAYPADVDHTYASRDGAHALLTMLIPPG
ncbi:helix-turn-helix domain-containing protein [Actinomycetes bacterium KLBMP 9759]